MFHLLQLLNLALRLWMNLSKCCFTSKPLIKILLFSNLSATAVRCFKKSYQKPNTDFRGCILPLETIIVGLKFHCFSKNMRRTAKPLCCTVIHSCINWENQRTCMTGRKFDLHKRDASARSKQPMENIFNWAFCKVSPRVYFPVQCPDWL